MDDAGILAKLGGLGLELPPPPQALAAYVPVAVHGGIAFVAGQVPMVDGVLMHPGRLGADVSVEDGARAAARCALQCLSALRAEIGSFEQLERLLRLDVFVAAASGFVEHPAVGNGASDLLVDVLGDAGRHARAAIGVASLPLGASVEVAMVAAVLP